MYRQRPNHLPPYYNDLDYGPESNSHYDSHFYGQQPMGYPVNYEQQTQQISTPYTQYSKPAQPQYMQPFVQQDSNMQMPQNNPGFKAYFYDENGQMDYGKVLTTVSQVANTFQQVTPVFQQINSLINSFRT